MSDVSTNDSRKLLKLCPFCGGEAEVEKSGSGVFDTWYVNCLTCCASVWENTEAEAIEAWNTRQERTCQILGSWHKLSQTQEMRRRICGYCGYELGVDRRSHFPIEMEWLCDMPNFCPNCGCRVKETECK